MTEQNERDESFPSLETEKVWDREEVFGSLTGATAAADPNDLQGLLDLTKAQFSRTVQEFEAFRRRAKEEKVKTILFCNEALVLDLIPILDDLDRSLAHLGTLPGDVGDGLRLVLQHFHKVLEKRNIQTIDPDGKAFDPLRHEAVQVSEVAGVLPGMVVNVIQKGYLCSGRLLRPARVVITPVAKPEPSPLPPAAASTNNVPAPPALPVPLPEMLELEAPVKLNGNQTESTWVIDDEALSDLEGSFGQGIPVSEVDAKIRSLS